MARRVTIWTWDVGKREIDMDGDLRVAGHALQTVLDGGLWNQFRKFPVDVVKQLLPSLQLPPNTRTVVELWIEEAEAEARQTS